jgi:hypothetical protein
MFSSLQPEFFHTKLKSDFYFFCPWKISNLLQLFPKSFLFAHAHTQENPEERKKAHGKAGHAQNILPVT